MKHILSLLALFLLLGSCAPQNGMCLSGRPMVQTQLFFGMDKKDGPVKPRQWQNFVSQVVAPRFKEGFSVVDAKGYWLSEEVKKTISENSKIILRVHADTPDEDAAINAVAGIYKKMFAQEAVMRVDTPVCVAF